MQHKKIDKPEICSSRQQGDILSHLEWAEKTVQSWPEWKRNILNSVQPDKIDSISERDKSKRAMEC